MLERPKKRAGWADFPHRYYVLVATCIFARRTFWLRNACLAAALLLPAVAAIHGLVLASLHVNGQSLPPPLPRIAVLKSANTITIA